MNGESTAYCTTDLCLSVKKGKKEDNVGAQKSVSTVVYVLSTVETKNTYSDSELCPDHCHKCSLSFFDIFVFTFRCSLLSY